MKKKLIPSQSVEQHSQMKIEEIDLHDIAVIGMSGRFANAENLGEYWMNIRDGVDSIAPFPERRRNDVEAFIDHQHVPLPFEFREGAFLNEIDSFDYKLFQITRKEASLMDPRQRLFLRSAWHAIEDAGYGDGKLEGTETGVFLGCSGDLEDEYYHLVQILAPSETAMAITGNIRSMMASRICYLLNLRGPSMVIDTACSSGLVAIHMACKSIQNQECDIAIAGGVKINLLPLRREEQLEILSSNGRTMSFDDESDGTGIGEGHAALLLKPLHKAIRDGDHVYAVIKGSAINQDGSSLGITAPNVQAQENVILKAWKDASIDPQTISYWEAHGTGTKLGDPIEVEAIGRAFSHFTKRKQFCALGSIKSNIGHLDGLAGLAGFCKAVLSLRNRMIPPTLHIRRPNKKINFEDSPLYINDRLTNWETLGTPRRCGVSSFGLSGTNCHMVLEEYIHTELGEGKRERPEGGLLVLSAKTQMALRLWVKQVREVLSDVEGPSLADICYTLATSRAHLSERLALVVQDKEQAVNLLNAWLEGVAPNEVDGFYCGKKVEGNESQTLFQASNFKEVLHCAAANFIQGVIPDWRKLSNGESSSLISLPGRPYQLERSWVRPEQGTEGLFHKVKWDIIEDEGEITRNLRGFSPRTVLLISDSEWGDLLAKGLEKRGNNVVNVKIGHRNNRILNEKRVEICGDKAAYEWLLRQYSSMHFTHILHCASITSAVNEAEGKLFNRALKNGLYSLFHLTQAILSHKWRHNIEMILISQNAYVVSKEEEILLPAGSALYGFGRCLEAEYPNLLCRSFDIDESTEPDAFIRFIEQSSQNYLTAIRRNNRYVQTVEDIDLQQFPFKPIDLCEDGIYLITGGTGELGLEVACYLASRRKTHLVLLCKSEFPERSEWERLVKEEHPLSRKIKVMLGLEREGSIITVCSIDVADQLAMAHLVKSLTEGGRQIRGIVHCAGVAGDGYIVNKSTNIMKEVLLPKIEGTIILDLVTRDQPIDFFILFSSITGLVGGPGQSDYTAANAFLDAFAQYRNKLGFPTTSINWVKWKKSNMKKGVLIEDGVTQKIYEELKTYQAVLALDEIMKRNITNIIVGKVVQKVTESVGQSPASQEARSASGNDYILHRVELTGENSNGYSEIERTIGNAWSDILGTERISIHDNFQQLGGDSIAAAQLARKLNETISDQIHIVDIYSYPTIKELASYVESLVSDQMDEAALKTDKKEENKPTLDEMMDRYLAGIISSEELDQYMKLGGSQLWKK